MVIRIVIAHYLGIQVGDNHMCTTALCQSSVTSIAADGIISVYDSFPIFVESCYKIESVIWEKSTSIKSL